MPFVIQKTAAPQVANAAYASLLKARIVGRTEASLVISNSGAATIKWKVLVSLDSNGTSNSWAEEKPEATLSSGAIAKLAISEVVAWVDIEIMSNASGTSGEGNAWILAVGI